MIVFLALAGCTLQNLTDGGRYYTANPNWKSKDGSAGHPDMPSKRILSACSAMNLYTECANQWNNGVTDP